MAPDEYDQALLERVAQSRPFESDVRMFRVASTFRVILPASRTGMKSCCHATYPDSFMLCPQDGTAPKKADSWAEGTVIRGKYRILNKIGQGEIAAGPFSGGASYFSTEASDSPSFSRIFVAASPVP
jgi:hypothetical protein